MSESSSGEREDRQASRTLCPVILQFLPLIALRELRPRLERAVYLHLATCESCAGELEQYQALMRLLRASRKRNGHQRQKRPGGLNSPYTTDNHGEQSLVPNLAFEPFLHHDGSILRVVSGNTALPSPYPMNIEAEQEAKGAMAFARSHNEDFRHAFAEALAGRKYTSSFPQADDAPEHAAASPHSSGKGKKPQRQAVNDAPADAFTTAVRRSLVAIAQLWHDPENQSRSEDHDIC